MTDENMNRTETDDSYARWQEIAIQQLTYVINLILTLSTASLGFIVSLITNQGFPVTDRGTRFFALSGILFLVAILLGLLCVINRLWDFKATRETIREKEKGATDAELKPLRDKKERYGIWTWRFFYGQIILFVLAILSFIVSIIIIYGYRFLWYL